MLQSPGFGYVGSLFSGNLHGSVQRLKDKISMGGDCVGALVAHRDDIVELPTDEYIRP